MLRQLFNTFVSQKEEITADEKLESSELRYRRLFETAQDGILILDGVSGKIDDVNPFLYELLGYLPGELIGKQLWEIGVFKDIAASKDAFEQLRARGYIRYNDLPLQTKDGRTINVEFVSNTYLVDNQKVVQCNVRDVTNRKKAEESVEARTRELEILNKTQEKTKSAMINVMEDLENERNGLTEAKAKNEAMLASIGDGFAIANEKGRLIYFNNFASDILGIDANQGLPDTWQKEYGIFDPVTLKPYPTDQMPLFLAVNGQAVNKVQLFIRNHKIRNGKYITVTATPIIMKGKSIGGVAIFRDTTQEREIDRAKSEFVSLASHQLRTPLGIMKWHLEALEDENYTKKAPSSIRNYLDAINKSNERLLSLVGDLLSVSRIDQGQVKNAPESVDIVKAVKEVVAQLRIVALKKRLRFVSLFMAKRFQL